MNTTINELVAIRIKELQAEAAAERLAGKRRPTEPSPVFSLRRIEVPGLRARVSKPI